MSDYISKNEVIEYLNEECEAGCIDIYSAQQRREIFREAIECIESFETIDAELVRHGKWLDYLKEGLKYKCSECESRFDRPYKYCPCCGAKMDGEEEI